MNKPHLLTIICLFYFNFSCLAQSRNNDYLDASKSNSRPNIIFIYVDDLGYGDLGNFWQNKKDSNQKMLTPNLDALANSGAMLTHHYTGAPVCAPARASLLEGLHQGHASVRDNQFDKPIKKGLTLASLLQKAGYRTLHVGKAGLAGKRSQTAIEPDPKTLEAHPLKRGFDQFFGYLYHIQGHQHYPQNGTTKQKAYFTNGYKNILSNTELTYTTDVFTAKSKQWITKHHKTRPEQPIFLYLSYDTPHAMLQVPTQAYPMGGGLHGGVQWTGENANTPWVNTASGQRDSYIHPDYSQQNWNETAKRHATMIRRIDNAIADIELLLKDLNIDQHTMIVFSSDNGPHHEAGSGGKYTQDPQFFQSYANMNGTKRDMWEAGIRVPTICKFPKVIPKNSQVTFPSGQWDWLATFADLAQVTIPEYTDGVSLMPVLSQNPLKQQNKGYTYHEYAVNSNTPTYDDFEPSKQGRLRKQMQVIRIGDFKGVRYSIYKHEESPFEIYNVVTDPKEHYNLASKMPKLQQQMMNKVLQVRVQNPSTPRPYDLELIPSVSLKLPKKGLYKKVYQSTSDWVPNFDYLTPIKTYTISGLQKQSKKKNSNLGLFYTGYIKIPKDGRYTFYLNSTAKCHIKIHDIHLLDTDFNYSTEETSSSLFLKAGFHPIRISYQHNKALIPKISLKIQSDSIVKKEIPNNFYFIETARE